MLRLGLAIAGAAVLGAGSHVATKLPHVELFQLPTGEIRGQLALPDGGHVEVTGMPPGPYFFLDGGVVPKSYW